MQLTLRNKNSIVNRFPELPGRIILRIHGQIVHRSGGPEAEATGLFLARREL